MTYVPPLDTSAARPRIPRELDPVEVRILGALMEKQMATPEYYPLTVNALVAACNQKSNREPVMELSESEVQRALDRLQDEKLVWKVMGGRAVRYDHNLDHVWHLNRREKALLTLLFLRGAQTAGELRGRSDRLFPFDDISAVASALQRMSAPTEQRTEPLVIQLNRQPGSKESRYAHLLGGPIDVAQYTSAPTSVQSNASNNLAERVAKLEEEVAELRALLADRRP